MKKLLTADVKVSKKEVNEVLKSEVSKSQKMKELFELGLEVKEISELMNVRYNFVYNVVSNFVRINDIETTSVERNSRKKEIIDLFLSGRSNVEISKELKINYNYVFKVIKEHKVENSK